MFCYLILIAKKVISKNINSALMIVLFTELVEAIQKFLMLFSRLSVTLDQHNSNQKIFCLSRDALLPAFYENPEFILEEEIENARYGLKIGDFGIDISNIEGMVRFKAFSKGQGLCSFDRGWSLVVK